MNLSNLFFPTIIVILFAYIVFSPVEEPERAHHHVEMHRTPNGVTSVPVTMCLTEEKQVTNTGKHHETHLSREVFD